MTDDVVTTLKGLRELEAQRSFENRRRYKYKLSFRESLEAFRSDEDIERIAERAGVCPDQIWRVYREHFRELLPKSSGRRLMRGLKQCKKRLGRGHRSRPIRHVLLANRLRKKTQAERLAAGRSKFEFVRETMRRARLHGCRVELVPIEQKHGSPWRVHKHLIKVNGRLTRVYRIQNSHSVGPHSPYRHGKTRLILHMLQEVEMVVFYLAVPGFPVRCYVVSSELLQQTVFGEDPPKDRKHFYIALGERPPDQYLRPRIHMDVYREAWHLFSPSRT